MDNSIICPNFKRHVKLAQLSETDVNWQVFVFSQPEHLALKPFKMKFKTLAFYHSTHLHTSSTPFSSAHHQYEEMSLVSPVTVSVLLSCSTLTPAALDSFYSFLETRSCYIAMADLVLTM